MTVTSSLSFLLTHTNLLIYISYSSCYTLLCPIILYYYILIYTTLYKLFFLLYYYTNLYNTILTIGGLTRAQKKINDTQMKESNILRLKSAEYLQKGLEIHFSKSEDADQPLPPQVMLFNNVIV